MSTSRVLVAAINYWPEPTGTAPYTTGFAEYLARKGHDVKVVAAMPHYPQWRVFEEYRGLAWRSESINSVQIARCRTHVPSQPSALGRALLEASFLLGALPLLRNWTPDVVLGVVPGISSAVVALAAARAYGVPLALWFQDLIGAGAVQSGVPGGKRWGAAATTIEGWLARQADRVIVVSQSFRPYLKAAGVPEGRTTLVRNWTHIAPPARDRELVREELGFSATDRICLHAGNMGYKQGLENIVRCARLSLARNLDLTFILSGDGNQRSSLEAQSGDLSNIRFLPTTDNAGFANVLAMADLLLLNQRASVTSMSLPSKLTSYLGAGRPIVAAVAPGEVSAVLTDAGAGTVVPPEDPEALLTAITSCLADPERRAEMGRRGYLYARTRLSADSTLAELERCCVQDIRLRETKLAV